MAKPAVIHPRRVDIHASQVGDKSFAHSLVDPHPLTSKACFAVISDLFVFCTVGVPQECWAPISKELGTLTVTNQYCFDPVSAAMSRGCAQGFSAKQRCWRKDHVIHARELSD